MARSRRPAGSRRTTGRAAGARNGAGGRTPARTTSRPAAKRTTTKRTATKTNRTAARRTSRKAGGKGATRTSAKAGTRPAAKAAARSRRAAARPKAPLSTAERVKRAVGNTVAAIGRRTGFGSVPLDALELLKADHRRLEALLDEGEQTTGRAAGRRQEILRTIARELDVHEQIEERLLYPALKAHPEASAIVLEGYEEHHVADVLLQELEGLSPADERWAAKFSVLRENIEHHIEEEEGEMFRTAQTVMPREELESLGAEMQRLKTQLSAPAASR